MDMLIFTTSLSIMVFNLVLCEYDPKGYIRIYSVRGTRPNSSYFTRNAITDQMNLYFWDNSRVWVYLLLLINSLVELKCLGIGF